MLDTSKAIQVLAKGADRRERRRQFFRNSGGLGVGLVGAWC